MAKLIIENISSQQAVELAHFYAQYGEQIADEWMQERGIRAPFTDINRKNGCMVKSNDGEIVTLFCK